MNTIQVLDKGSVTLLDHMGSDLSVVNAARVSFSKQSQWGQKNPVEGNVLEERDAKLIQYLAKHEHWTPFGHPQLSFHIKMPIFVARQLMRSNVGIVYNEVSRRYVDSPPEFYEPKEWRSRPTGSMKQGSGEALVGEYAAEARSEYDALLGCCIDSYDSLIREGVAPEMARMVLPLSTYTEVIATMSLAAAARVVKLRIDPHAQLEIQAYARAIDKLAQPLFPVSWPALLGANHQSGSEETP